MTVQAQEGTAVAGFASLEDPDGNLVTLVQTAPELTEKPPDRGSGGFPVLRQDTVGRLRVRS
ncbi:hypothetical protein BJF86_08780 [Serinicoccus sp. CNJ-927]|nr:hypothetical protein BJF86_08780 [Serinicoccus sp. CNJ-927]